MICCGMRHICTLAELKKSFEEEDTDGVQRYKTGFVEDRRTAMNPKVL